MIRSVSDMGKYNSYTAMFKMVVINYMVKNENHASFLFTQLIISILSTCNFPNLSLRCKITKSVYFIHHNQVRDAKILTTSSNVQLSLANFLLSYFPESKRGLEFIHCV
jgi:hypothetical protein